MSGACSSVAALAPYVESKKVVSNSPGVVALSMVLQQLLTPSLAVLRGHFDRHDNWFSSAIVTMASSVTTRWRVLQARPRTQRATTQIVNSCATNTYRPKGVSKVTCLPEKRMRKAVLKLNGVTPRIAQQVLCRPPGQLASASSQATKGSTLGAVLDDKSDRMAIQSADS